MECTLAFIRLKTSRLRAAVYLTINFFQNSILHTVYALFSTRQLKFKGDGLSHVFFIVYSTHTHKGNFLPFVLVLGISGCTFNPTMLGEMCF